MKTGDLVGLLKLIRFLHVSNFFIDERDEEGTQKQTQKRRRRNVEVEEGMRKQKH